MASDVEAEDREEQEEKPFAVERAKTGRAKCKKCKQTIEKGEIRMAKYVTSFFADGKLMPAWHHVTCLFEVFAKQRATTRRIDDPERDVKGWDLLADEDRQLILERLQELDSCNYRIDHTRVSFHAKSSGNYARRASSSPTHRSARKSLAS